MITLEKPTVIRVIERAHGDRPFRDILADAYREEGSQQAVADRFGVPLRTLQRLQKKIGVRTVHTIPDAGNQ